MDPLNIGTVLPLQLENEMRSSYMDYAMSVIVSRALRDPRNGLKPVHRRILYAMQEQGMTPGARYQKCAAIIGEVLKHYHPHGDQSVYDSLVRLAQNGSLRYPLVDGQGNFGSIDGDSAAAYRYTEARLGPIAAEVLVDLAKNTVDFCDNYSGNQRGASRVARSAAEPDAQRLIGNRRRHDDQHSAAQPRRGLRRRNLSDRASGRDDRRPDEVGQRSGLPDRRHHHRSRGNRGRLWHRPWPADRSRAPHLRGGQERPRADHHHRDSLHGQQGA